MAVRLAQWMGLPTVPFLSVESLTVCWQALFWVGWTFVLSPSSCPHCISSAQRGFPLPPAAGWLGGGFLVHSVVLWPLGGVWREACLFPSAQGAHPSCAGDLCFFFCLNTQVAHSLVCLWWSFYSGFLLSEMPLNISGVFACFCMLVCACHWVLASQSLQLHRREPHLASPGLDSLGLSVPRGSSNWVSFPGSSPCWVLSPGCPPGPSPLCTLWALNSHHLLLGPPWPCPSGPCLSGSSPWVLCPLDASLGSSSAGRPAFPLGSSPGSSHPTLPCCSFLSPLPLSPPCLGPSWSSPSGPSWSVGSLP